MISGELESCAAATQQTWEIRTTMNSRGRSDQMMQRVTWGDEMECHACTFGGIQRNQHAYNRVACSAVAVRALRPRSTLNTGHDYVAPWSEKYEPPRCPSLQYSSGALLGVRSCACHCECRGSTAAADDSARRANHAVYCQASITLEKMPCANKRGSGLTG